MNNWIKRSPALNELLLVTGICPLLGAVTNFQAGLTMAILFTLTFIILAVVVSVSRHLFSLQIRRVVIVSISVTVVNVLYMVTQAVFYEQSQLLGIYGYLIAVSALILVFAREEWNKISLTDSIKQALIMSLVITVMLVLIGTAREHIQLQLLKEPAGAFIMLALLLALIRWIDSGADGRISHL